jgi:hypothetical protein
MIGLWMVMNTMTATSYDAVDICLQFMQLLNIVQGFNVPWHHVLEYLRQLMAFVNFDIDYISLSCLFPYTYFWSFGVTMLLPVIVIIVNAFQVLVLQRDQKHAISNILVFLVVVYNGLCTKVLGSFICEDLVGGSAMLLAAPEITCWEGGHIALVGASVVLVFVYIIAIPVGFGLVLNKGFKSDLLGEAEFLVQYGFLYIRYEKSFHMWEVWLLCRRFGFCAIQVLIQQHPHIQSFCGMILCLVSIVMQYSMSPFHNSMLDVLDCAGLTTLFIYLLCGLAFMDGRLHESNLFFGSTYETLGILCFVLTALTILFALAICVLDYIGSRKFRHISRMLNKAAEMHLLRRGGRSPSMHNDEVENHPAADENWDGKIHPMPETNAEVDAPSRLGLKMKSMGLSSIRIKGRSGLFQAFAVSQRRRKVADFIDSAVLDVFEPVVLKQWTSVRLKDADPKAAAASLELIGRVSEIIGHGFSATSTLSGVHANNRVMRFYHRLASAQPYLIDAALSCSASELEAFASAARWMRQFEATYTHRGGLSNLVVPMDRASLLMFLVESGGSEGRRDLLTFIQDLWDVRLRQISSKSNTSSDGQSVQGHSLPRTRSFRAKAGFVGRYYPFVIPSVDQLRVSAVANSHEDAAQQEPDIETPPQTSRGQFEGPFRGG